MIRNSGKQPIAPLLVNAILRRDHLCISTELKWKCAEYGIYHDESARAADQSPEIERSIIPASEYPILKNKKIYKSKINPPTQPEINAKAQAYSKVLETQGDDARCGLFAQAVISLAFWKAYVQCQSAIAKLGEKSIISIRPQTHLQGRVPELDIYLALSRNQYGVDAKNKLEMQTPRETFDNRGRTLKDLIEIWSARGIRPIIACPLSSRTLKSNLMRAGGRSYDYNSIILLHDEDTFRAFAELGMTAVTFLPKIEMNGSLLNGREFQGSISSLSDEHTVGQLLDHIKYDNPTLSALTQKSKGMLILLTLNSRTENFTLYGSKTDALKAAIDYLIYQYTTAATTGANLNALTTYVRDRGYLPAAAAEALRKISIEETKAVVESSTELLSAAGLVSSHNDLVTCTFGTRPEAFLQLNRAKLHNDFGL